MVWLMSSLMGPVTHYFQGIQGDRVLLQKKLAMFSLQLHLQFSHRGIHVIVVITMYSCMFHKFE